MSFALFAIATGEMSVVSHTPQTLPNYLRHHPEIYHHITARKK